MSRSVPVRGLPGRPAARQAGSTRRWVAGGSAAPPASPTLPPTPRAGARAAGAGGVGRGVAGAGVAAPAGSAAAARGLPVEVREQGLRAGRADVRADDQRFLPHPTSRKVSTDTVRLEKTYRPEVRHDA